MGIAIGINTVAVGVVAWLFFQELSVPLPAGYLWAIRLSLVIFIVASLQGYLMGGRLQHSVGGADGTLGLPFLNWSRSVGDLRVAHLLVCMPFKYCPYWVFSCPNFLAHRSLLG